MDLQDVLYKISIGALPILLAITLHEVAHGYVARRFGDRTADAQGRLSLNPLKHVDPIGTVVLPGVLLLTGASFLFGWAKPVPVVPRNLRNPKADMAWVAAAGPGVNLAMAFAWALVGTLVGRDLLGDSDAGRWVVAMAQVGVFFNVLLAVFNMLPIPPLDGGRVLMSVLPPRPSNALGRLEPYGIFIVLGALLLPVIGGPNVFAAVLAPPIMFVIEAIRSIVP
jgi:Zn-dependent protease